MRTITPARKFDIQKMFQLAMWNVLAAGHRRTVCLPCCIHDENNVHTSKMLILVRVVGQQVRVDPVPEHSLVEPKGAGTGVDSDEDSDHDYEEAEVSAVRIPGCKRKQKQV
jgi:hypothetical protein